ncbi:hypothetical protein H312_01027 [Anncaliia algerae PRA339]|uniref:Uncharacterized protein n=1 Tax=Anncaliia algerae PRA339 TaxID=1288291 RepID=A0A059F2V7_9MICR|nr:hypothetical protein H312_01027 [Anncaliia algerae PRA339]
MKHGINARWRCSKSTCRFSCGLFKDSIFYDIYFTFSKALRCIYFQSLNISQLEIAAQLLFDEKIVSSFINNFMYNILMKTILIVFLYLVAHLMMFLKLMKRI